MFSALGNILRRPIRVIAAIAADPIRVWTRFQDRFAQLREERDSAGFRYDPDADWARRLHDFLRVPWPCETTSEFRVLWHEVVEELTAKGVRVGPESFGCWNDGDTGLVRAIWCLVRHLRPRTIIETGVAHGVTSRFILEALDRNAKGGGESGHLWSIDLPPLETEKHAEIAIAVGDRFVDRWTYIEGSSRRRLPVLLSRLGAIDLFIHDSLHSERNVRFEVDRAWAALRPGGAIVIDDIDINRGFASFRETFSGFQSLVCEAEPLHPDLRRYNTKGLFGIILKDPAGGNPHGERSSGPPKLSPATDYPMNQ